MSRRRLPFATTAQRQALTDQVLHEVIYDTDLARFFTWNGTAWVDQVTGAAEAAVPALPAGATANWDMDQLTGAETDTIEGIVCTATNNPGGDGEKRSFVRTSSQYLLSSALTPSEEDAVLPKLADWSFAIRLSDLVPDPVETQSRIWEVDAVGQTVGLTLLADGTKRFVVSDDKVTYILADGVSTSSDCVVCGVVDRSANELRLYVDGALEATEDITGLGSLDDGSRGVAFASTAFFSATRLLTGDIWQSTIWAGKALDQSEIDDVVDNFNGTSTGGGGTPSTGEGDSLLDGLVAAWPLDGVSGTRNSEFGDFPLSDNNTVTFADGKTRARCARFTSANTESLSITNDPLFSQLGAFSASVWVKLRSLASDQHIVSKWDAAGDNRDWWLFYDNASSRFIFRTNPLGTTGTPADAVADTFGAPVVDTWYLVDIEYDGIGTAKIAVNAGAQDSVSGTVHAGSGDFTIGALRSDILPSDADVQDVLIWDRLRTAAERTLVYNDDLGFTYPFRFKPTA